MSCAPRTPAGAGYRWPVAVIRAQLAAVIGPQAVGRDPPAGASYPPPMADRSTADRPPTEGNAPRLLDRGPTSRAKKNAQGPPNIGSESTVRQPKTAIRDPRPAARVTGARAMFLANNHIIFSTSFNCLIFAVKIAYITCYVSRETCVKTAYQKLARDPYECSRKSGVRREKIEA